MPIRNDTYKLINERTGDSRTIGWCEIAEYYADLYNKLDRDLAISIGNPNTSKDACLKVAQRICAEEWKTQRAREREKDREEEIAKYKKQIENDLANEVQAYKEEILYGRQPPKEKKVVHTEDSLMAQRFRRLKREWREEGKDITTTTLYHGTKETNIEAFIRNGFILPMTKGMLGAGIYLGQFEKAENYAGHNGMILKVLVMLGKCKELCDVELIEENRGFDSLHLRSGYYHGVNKGFLKNEEWVIRNPDQIKLVSFERNSHGRSWV